MNADDIELPEPFATLHDDGCYTRSKPLEYKERFAGWRADVFTADQLRAAVLAERQRGATAVEALSDERAAFESWAHSSGFNIQRDETDKYKDYHRATTRFARDGWLSALSWVKHKNPLVRELREAIDRTWHVLKKHGKHPDRADDTLWDCVDAALAARAAAQDGDSRG